MWLSAIVSSVSRVMSSETSMGWPVDLEVAFRDDTLYLLQCRPITTLRTAASAQA